MSDNKRRDFLGLALAGTATVGGAAALFGLKRSWDALPSVLSAGYTTVDLSQAQAGKLYTVVWRGKPIFILKKTNEMTSCDKREIVVGEDRYSVMIGLCTHLGCIPAYKEDKQQFKCACHGGEFDSCGTQTFGPPPRPLDLPPFSISGTKMVLGEEGEEYKKMIQA
ncbi:Ubiquinol-cytochrome C reductase iron-sulfur subunit [hydrothermal vent metagenome]|uniref:Ubiquinol-cytochrome C reductase iron-sulfur subunit n=1 Tax=hydrothermal vent metagenome TaxID=652676 RepID=A0A3B1EA17_9ZZZZ